MTDTDIKNNEGFFSNGESISHGDEKNQKQNKDGFLLKGEEYGYIDNDGNIHQKDGTFFKGRAIGKMKGNNKDAALNYFILKFKNLEKKYDSLKHDFDNDSNKAKFLGKIRQMLESVPTADALGDFDSLISKIKKLEEITLIFLDKNLALKENLIREAETLSLSTDWKGTPEKLKKLDEEWKRIGPVAKEKMDELWNRFYNTKQIFFDNRSRYFDEMENERQTNLTAKENLCMEAEKLSNSTDWKSTAEKLKHLDEEWKKLGPVPKEDADSIWKRFNNAKQTFWDNRKKFFADMDREKLANLSKKEKLCTEAEHLIYSTDWKNTGEHLKYLQSEWKKIGPVPKEKMGEIWERFNSAVQGFFENRTRFFEERDMERTQRHKEWQERMQETIERLEESISHDENILEELNIKLNNVRPGNREQEIKNHYWDRIDLIKTKIEQKRRKLEDIRSKL